MTGRILILGSGFAGLWAAIGAARRRDELSLEPAEVAITLITREPFHDIRVRNYEADLTPSRLPLGTLLDPVGVRTVLGEIESVDAAGASVRVRGDPPLDVGYDRLVLALGSRLVRPPIPGLDEFAFDIDTWPAAERLSAHLTRLTVDAIRQESATVVVVGAGLTGIEAATEMVARLEAVWDGVPDAPQRRVVLVDHQPHAGSDMGDDARPVIEEALRELGIETVLGVRVTAIRRDGVEFDAGLFLPAATVVWCAGMRANPIASQLPISTDHLGRLPVDECMRVEGLDGVFAAGDIARAQMEGMHPSVMSCQHSRPMGRFAGHNVVSDLVGAPMLQLQIPWYVTVLDLGAAGAVYTEGWDRHVVAVGDDAKATKVRINTQRIYPPSGGDRRALLEAAAAVVQKPPEYGHDAERVLT